MTSGFLQLESTYKVGTGCKDTLVICNSVFSIFLNQIKAQRDQRIIVWIEYFPYIYHSRCFGIRGGHGKSAFKLAVKLSVELGYVFLSLRL
jgi:hypothetical protein